MEKIQSLFEIITYNQEEIRGFERELKLEDKTGSFESVMQMFTNAIGSLDIRLRQKKATTQLLAEQLYKQLVSEDGLFLLEGDSNTFEYGDYEPKEFIYALKENRFSAELCENVKVEVIKSASNFTTDGDGYNLPLTVDCDVDETVSIIINDVEYLIK